MSTNEEVSSDESVTSSWYYLVPSFSKKNVEVMYLSSGDEGEGDDLPPPVVLNNNKNEDAPAEVSVDDKSPLIKDNLAANETDDMGSKEDAVGTVELEPTGRSTQEILDGMTSGKIGQECKTSSTDIYSSQASYSPVKFSG